MKHLAAYCLLVLGGKAAPTKKDVEDLMKASGVTADSASLDVMMTRLEGKSIPELMAEGAGKMASMPSGGASAGPAASSDAPAAEKKEEKAEEPEPEVDMTGMFGEEDDY